jgi:hypothetical protein
LPLPSEPVGILTGFKLETALLSSPLGIPYVICGKTRIKTGRAANIRFDRECISRIGGEKWFMKGVRKYSNVM